MSLLFEMGLINTVSTALLAAVVFIVTRIRWNSHIAWALWFVVLLKLVVPPLVSVPLPEQLSFRLEPIQDAAVSLTHQQPDPSEQLAPVASSDRVNEPEPAAPPATAQALAQQTNVPADVSSSKVSTVTIHPAWLIALNWAGRVWLLGSAIWFVMATVRIFRFHRQVQKAVPASEKLQSLVDSLAKQMKIERAPRALVFEGRVSPMLWPVGRRLSILLPNDLLGRLDSDQQTTLIAHELAHVRRRDYLVRWFELLVLGLYWWNPIAWWARQQLQQSEEQCCDALVIATLPTKAKQYAQAIFETVEFLSASQPLRTPVVSGFMFHFNIHRRLEMIVQGKTKSHLSPVRKSLLLFIGIGLLAVGPMSLLAEPQAQEAQSGKSESENAVAAPADASQQSEAAEKNEEASPAQAPSAIDPNSTNDSIKKMALDPELINDLRQMQGTWELYHGNEHNGAPNTHSVKTIKGNVETLRRYSMQGKLVRQHSVEFILEKDGDFKIFTFYPVGGEPEQGYSFLYRVQGDRFFDVPGLFAGKKHRNYLKEPAFWVWHRVKKEDQAKTKDPKPSSEAPAEDATPKPKQPQPKTTNQEKQTTVTPPLKFIISIMPGDHIFVGHKHNNKYNHHTLSSLQDHLMKTKPKHVTLAVDAKADTAFAQRVTDICKELDVQTIDVRKTSNIPAVKATPPKQPADKK